MARLRSSLAQRGAWDGRAVRLAQEGADIIATDLARDEPDIDYRQGTPEDLQETVRLVEAECRRRGHRGVRRDRARQAGPIVIISSTAGLVGAPNQAHYTASKHGLQGLAATTPNEFGPHPGL